MQHISDTGVAVPNKRMQFIKDRMVTVQVRHHIDRVLKLFAWSQIVLRLKPALDLMQIGAALL